MLVGAWIISVLPANIVHAFSYCLVAMMGSMLLMRFTMGGKSVKENLVSNVPYMAWGIFAYFLSKMVPALANWKTLIAVGGALIIAYFIFLNDKKKLEAK